MAGKAPRGPRNPRNPFPLFPIYTGPWRLVRPKEPVYAGRARLLADVAATGVLVAFASLYVVLLVTLALKGMVLAAIVVGSLLPGTALMILLGGRVKFE